MRAIGYQPGSLHERIRRPAKAVAARLRQRIEARKAADKLTNRGAGASAGRRLGPMLAACRPDRAIAAGGKLVAEETAKRQRHPLDRWDEVVDRAEADSSPRAWTSS